MSWRRDFDAARDPYTARNALGITSTGGGGGAPTTAEYITAATDPTLTAERVLTNTTSITWDFSTPGQAKASTTAGGGNVSNSGTPTVGQYAKWVTATTIQGVAPATVLGDIGAAPLASPVFTGDPKAPTPAIADNDTSIATTAYVQAQGYLTSAAATAAYQPLDADLTAIAALTGTNTIYYRSAANTWAAVTIGTGLSFTGGTLANTVPAGAPVGAEYITSAADATLTAERVLTNTATITWDFTTPGQAKASTAAGGGNVSNSGTPTAGQYAKWVTATTIAGVPPATVLSDIGGAASTDFPAGAWTAWTPTISSAGGTITSSTINRARYTRLGKTIIAVLDVTITNAGSGTGAVQFTLPVQASASGGGMVNGFETGLTGAMAGYPIGASDTLGFILGYSGTGIIGTNGRYRVNAVYEGV